MKLRPTLLWLHRWVGVVSAVFLLLIALTGCALIFENALDRRLNASLAYVTPQDTRLALQTLVERTGAALPGVRVGSVRVDPEPSFATSLSLSNRLTAFVNPYTGELLGTRDTQQGLARNIHLLHTRFMAGYAGELFVGWLTVLTLAMSISGIYLWWPRQIFVVGRYSSWRRANFDLHSVLGLWASGLIFLISLSGIIIAFEKTTDPLILKMNPGPAPTFDRLKSTPVPGGQRITVDQALAAATAALPGAAVSNISLPAKPTDIYRLTAKFPEDRTPAGRSRLYIDQFSGAVLGLESTRSAPAGTRLLNLKRSAHTGDIIGTPSQVLYFIGSLALTGQIVSGVLIWWKPKRKAATAAGRQTSVA
ncbi:MAG: PepSY-associated TM helix domain-containing protein [Vicinamibacterales bacterium]